MKIRNVTKSTKIKLKNLIGNVQNSKNDKSTYNKITKT